MECCIKNPIELGDLDNLSINEGGVDNFYWPVHRSQLLDAVKVIKEVIIDVIGVGVRDNDQAAKNIMTIHTKTLLECLAIAQAEILVSKLRENHFHSIEFGRNLIWKSLFERKALPTSSFVQSLRLGVPRPFFLRRYCRLLKNFKSDRIFSFEPIEIADFDNTITCTTVCPLTQIHAREVKETVSIVPLYEWFYPPSKKEISDCMNIEKSLPVNHYLIDCISRKLGDLGIYLSEHSITYLREFLSWSHRFIQLYRYRLRRMSSSIPSELWIGTSGIVWSRILADAVRDRGGIVCGHDHALGANYSEISPAPYTELQNVDRFFTFTEAQKRLYARRTNDSTITGNVPDIMCPRRQKLNENMDASSTGKPKLKEILLVVPFYPTDANVGPQPLFPVMVAVDWQVRLVNYLLQEGFRVSLQPHPESPYSVHEYFTRKEGVELSTERFEVVCRDYDLIIFDFPLTTTFGHALRTDCSVVLIDFGFFSLLGEDMDLLKKRCPVVPGKFDRDNRAQVNWGDLKKAFSEAANLRDNAYAIKVLGHVGS